MPKLDCSTRWHSTVDMVESLLSLKDICDNDARLHLSESTWDELTEFLKSLTPAKELTKKLQEEQLTVGDFYLAWMMCQIKLNQMTTKLTTDIVAAMKRREILLFENDIFINGMCLDPRVNSVLTQVQIQKAKENLTKLYVANFELELGNKENINYNTSNINSDCSNAQFELDEFLNSSYINKHDNLISLLCRHDSSDNLVCRLQSSLDQFLNEPLLSSKEHVLIYWQKSKDKYPYLYKLSTIVLASPMTQVSVERLFSSLKFVVSNYRLSLKDDVIEDLLFIRCNNLFNK